MERLYKLHLKGWTKDYGHRFTRSGRLCIDWPVFFREVYLKKCMDRLAAKKQEDNIIAKNKQLITL